MFHRHSFLHRIFCSVFPKAAFVGLLGSLLGFGLLALRQNHGYQLISYKNAKDNDLYSVYSVALGFLVVFRNGQAYDRWWDGAKTLGCAMTEWMDACMQLVSCTTSSHADHDKVIGFNHVVIRLFSLLTAVAFKHIGDMEDEDFEVLSLTGMDDISQSILRDSNEEPRKMLAIVEQWILNTIHAGMQENPPIISAPPPIVSRVFQEIGNGSFQIEKLFIISTTQLPAPYRIMLDVLLYIHVLYTCVVASVLIDNPAYISIVVFFAVFGLQCINFIAMEIEHPFGDDLNDISVHHAQAEINEHLRMLIDPRTYHKPTYDSLDALETSIFENMNTHIVFDEGKEGCKLRSSSGLVRTAHNEPKRNSNLHQAVASGSDWSHVSLRHSTSSPSSTPTSKNEADVTLLGKTNEPCSPTAVSCAFAGSPKALQEPCGTAGTAGKLLVKQTKDDDAWRRDVDQQLAQQVSNIDLLVTTQQKQMTLLKEISQCCKLVRHEDKVLSMKDAWDPLMWDVSGQLLEHKGPNWPVKGSSVGDPRRYLQNGTARTA